MPAANRTTVRVVKRKPPKRVEPTGDTKGAGELRKAEAFKKTPSYRKAVRVAYDSNPPEERRKRVVRARTAPSTVESRTVLKVADDRAARKVATRKSAATKDTKGDVDRKRGRTASDLNIARGRLEKWSKSHSGTVKPGDALDAIKKELEGRGALAKGLSKVGKLAVEGNPALKVSGTIGALRGKKNDDLATRAVHDLVNLPAQVVPSLYVPAAGVVEAAQGKPKRLKGFAKDIQEGDPLYKLGEAGVAALKGDTGKAGRSLKKAKDLGVEHPGFAVAEAFGARGTVGRGAGRVMRSGVAGKRAKRAASTERESRVVPGTKIEEKRAYSPDVITKREQKLGEKIQRDRADALRGKAKRATDPDEADRLNQQAAKRDPSRLPEHEIERRVDERVDANETVRRAHRAGALNKARKTVRKVKAKQRTLVNLIAQGIVRADPDDIRAYVKELEGEFDGLSPEGKRANKVLRRKIMAALDSDKLDVGKVERAAKDYADAVRPLEDHLVKHSLLDAEQAEKSRLIPYAVRRMGAKHEKDANGMGRIVGKNGDLLTPGQIRAHMKKHGRDDFDPVFLSQAPNSRGARNYFVTSSRAPGIGTAKRTGEATRKGTFDAHPDTLPEQAARAQGLVDAHTGFGGFVDEFAIRSKGGKVRAFTSKKQATEAARRRMVNDDGEPIHGAHEFVAVRINPFGGSKEQLAHLLEDVNSGSATNMSHEAIVGAIEDALKGKGSDEGMWALVPKAAAGRMEEHMRVLKPGTAGKVGQAVNSAFRRTVLATSPAWFTGNVVEGTVRAALAKAGPRSWLTAKRVLSELSDADVYHGNFKGERHDAGIATHVGSKGAARERIAHRRGDSPLKRILPPKVEGFRVRADARILDLDEKKMKELGLWVDIKPEHLRPGFSNSDSAQGKLEIGREWAEKTATERDTYLDAEIESSRKAGFAYSPAEAERIKSYSRKTSDQYARAWEAVKNYDAIRYLNDTEDPGSVSYMVLNRNVLRDAKTDPEALARMLPGGHFGSAERQHVHRDISQFADKKYAEPVARALGAFWRTPGPKQAAQAWHAWTTLVFHSVNGGIESQIQKAMLGAEIRRSPLMDGAGRKLSAKAIQQAAEGIRNTNEQVAFGRAVDRMYGKYGKYSPDMRKAIALYTPFVAWTINATKFVTMTLPRDHPTTLAVIAASEQATEEWRKEHGLDKFIDGKVPAWLQGSIPGKGGEKFRGPMRFTPFGIGGDPFGTAAGAVLPQAQGVLSAMKGFDWKGKKLEDDSDLGRLKAAARSGLEATVPLLSTGQRVVKKGPEAFIEDAVTGKVSPPKKRARKGSSGTAGRIVGPGASGGKIVGPGSGSGKIVP